LRCIYQSLFIHHYRNTKKIQYNSVTISTTSNAAATEQGLRSVTHHCSAAMQQFALNALLHAAIRAADKSLQNIAASAKWAWFDFKR